MGESCRMLLGDQSCTVSITPFSATQLCLNVDLQSYAGTLGARITTTGARNPASVGCLISAGHDFPERVVDALRDWGLTLVVIRDPAKLSTRSLLRYEGAKFEGERAFRPAEGRDPRRLSVAMC